MKKIFYLAACALFCLNTSAQSYWGENSNATFDEWVDVKDKDENVTGERPKGWHAPYNDNWALGSNSVGVAFEAADDRNSEPRSACKITTSGIASTWFSWHIQMRPVHWASESDYNPVYIEQGDDFFYTFWAKCEGDNDSIWIGCEQNYDPNGGKLGWDKMPRIKLTTEWKQYGYVDYALVDLLGLQIQLRRNGITYIDDIQLEYGDELPELNVEEPNFIFEIASNQNPISLISSTNGIAFNSLAGCVSIYDAMGKEIIANREVKQGNNFISLETKGLHIVKFRQGNMENAIKAIVR